MFVKYSVNMFLVVLYSEHNDFDQVVDLTLYLVNHNLHISVGCLHFFKSKTWWHVKEGYALITKYSTYKGIK